MRQTLMRSLWVMSSFIAVAVGGAALAVLIPLAWRLQAGLSFSTSVLTSPGWWVADGLAGGVLSLIGLSKAPSVRRLLIAGVASFLVYVVVGSALTSIDAIGSYDTNVAGSGWGEAFYWSVLMSIVLAGNGWAAFIAPVALDLLPFRRWLVGAPVVWVVHRYGPADDDAAAEDFGIY